MVWLKLTAEAVPPAVGGRAASRADGAAYLGPVRAPGAPPSWPPPASTTRCRCASAPTGCRCARSRRPARWPSWAAARRPASTGSPRRSTTTARPPPFRTAIAGDPGPVVDAPAGPDRARSPRAQRYEEAAVVRVPAGRAAAGHRADAAAGRADRGSPSWSPPGRDAGGGWEIAVVRHGRLAGGGRVPAAASHPRPTLDAVRWPPPRRSGPGPGPAPARHRRGDRADPVLAGAAGDPAGGDVRRLGRPRSPARRASATCSAKAEAARVAAELSTERPWPTDRSDDARLA